MKGILRACALHRLPARSAGFFTVLFMAAFFLSCDQIPGLEDVLDDDRDTATKANRIQPEGPNPEWAPDIDPQMLAVIEQFQSYGAVYSAWRVGFTLRLAK